MNDSSKPSTASVIDPEKWVDDYGDYLFRYAIMRVRDSNLAEDLVQETFLAALKGVAGFEGRSSEKTWLTAILRNKIVDQLRHRIREARVETRPGEDPTEAAFTEKGAWHVRPAHWRFQPHELFEQQAFWKVFVDCLRELPARLAEAFRLRELDGLDCKEICNLMDISASNCWVMLYRARMRLRRCLEQNWFEHDPH